MENSLRVVQNGKVQQNDYCPETERDERIILFPPMTANEGNNGDTREEKNKRNRHPEFNRGLVQFGFGGEERRWQEKCSQE
jgi:hypothetical protein